MGGTEMKCPVCRAGLDPGSSTCPSCGLDVQSILPTQCCLDNNAPAGVLEQRLGDFLILRTIGRGGMGTVYEAFQQSMRRRVALKVMDSGITPSTSETSRFEREAWIAGRLSHPNIVKAYGHGVERGTHYIAMELVEGHSLATEIKQVRKPGEQQPKTNLRWQIEHIDRMVTLFVGVADGLQHLHEHGIVHRDIKPQNLLLTKDSSRLLMTDFGLAQDAQASRLTRRGDFLGTIRYMSPEQLLAHRAKIDCRSDIWSLGVSLYETLTFDLPYSATGEEAYISAVSLKQPIPARTRNRAVPRDLETVLMKCLERDPQERYQSAAQLRDDLRRFLDERPVLARRPGLLVKGARFLKRQRRAVTAAALGTILVVTALAIGTKMHAERTDLDRIYWTLQQIIQTNKEPSELQPDWTRLEKKLRQEVRKAPSGSLASVAQRASVNIMVGAPAFGLVSQPPYVQFDVKKMFNPGVAFPLLMEVEVSWDGGPWRPFVTCAVPGDSEGNATYGDGNLRDFLAQNELTAGPHRLEYRVRLSFFYADFKEVHETVCYYGNRTDAGTEAQRQTLELLRKLKPTYQETRVYSELSINLFETFPEDFPKQVDATEPPAFHIDRVRMLVVGLPDRTGSQLLFDWKQPRELWLSGLTPPTQVKSLLAGLEFEGRWNSETLLPISAEGSLQLETEPQPILGFDFIFGGGIEGIKPRGWLKGSSIASESVSSEGGSNYLRIISGMKWLEISLGKGSSPGRLEFLPSRRVALETRKFNRFYGKPISMPVTVEFITVDGRWR